MKIHLSEGRRALLVELENLVGNEFYNGKVRNYGPGGIRLSDGRDLRYPVTFQLADGEKLKLKGSKLLDSTVPTASFLTGHYVLGANHLDIMLALHRVVEHLEQRYGFSIDAGHALDSAPHPDSMPSSSDN